MASESKNECSICLEAFKSTSRVGVVENCNHLYHESCILSWSKQSNSCPTCRSTYHELRITRYSDTETTLRTFRVQDRLLPTDAIDYIPREFIIPASTPLINNDNYLNPTVDIGEPVTGTSVCSVCSSAYLAMSPYQRIISCSYCGAGFHYGCLGFTEYNSKDIWQCTTCNGLQEVPLEYSKRSSNGASKNVNFFTRQSSSRTYNRTKANSKAKPKQRLLANIIEDEWSLSGDSSETNIGFALNNKSLDDDFSDSDHDEYPSRSGRNSQVMNGGVRLRREIRERQRLSKEELQSWDLFDKARANFDDREEQNLDAPKTSSSERKKRKKHTPSETLNRKHSEPESGRCAKAQYNSKISRLISEAVGSSSRDSCNRSSTVAIEEMSSHKLSDAQHLTETPLPVPTKFDLSRENKLKIQKVVKGHLKRYYNPSVNSSSTDICITSVADYESVNKSASRKIYGHIISLAKTNGGQINEKILKSCLNDSAKLGNIIKHYLNKEIISYYGA